MYYTHLTLLALFCVLSTAGPARCHAQSLGSQPASARGAVVPTDSHLVVRQWVQRSAEGALQGRVVLPGLDGNSSPVAGAHVALVGPGGTVHRATCDAEGNFAIADVPQGVYALTAQGEGVFAAYALHVVAGAESAADYPDQVEIAAAAIDRATVKTSILRYLPPRGPERVNRTLDAVALDAMAERVCANVTSRVVQVAGGLRGVIRLAGADGQKLAAAPLVNVFISQNGEQVARTVTDADGRFTIDALAPGSYSLLAVGPGGLGSVGFELIADGAAAQASRTGGNVRFASYSHDPHCSDCFCDSLGLQVAPLPEIVTCVESMPVEEVVVAPPIVVEEQLLPLPAMDAFPPGFVGGYGGGFAGGYGGGGGGFFGGGGWAGLAALGGIAAAIAADDDDDGFVVPLPLSPAAP